MCDVISSFGTIAFVNLFGYSCAGDGEVGRSARSWHFSQSTQQQPAVRSFPVIQDLLKKKLVLPNDCKCGSFPECYFCALPRYFNVMIAGPKDSAYESKFKRVVCAELVLPLENKKLRLRLLWTWKPSHFHDHVCKLYWRKTMYSCMCKNAGHPRQMQYLFEFLAMHFFPVL